MDIRLSPEQKKIVEETEGAHLVLASAGSGKTRVLTERIKRLLGSKQRRYRVLALTFTNRAADEMKERLKDVPDLGERSFVGTIHAFCQMVLEAHYSALGEGERMPTIFERDEDRMALMEKAVQALPTLGKQFQAKTEKEQRTVLVNLLASLSAAKRGFLTGLPGLSESLCMEYADDIRETFASELRRQQAIDFDDLLVLTYRLFTEQPHILEHYTRIYRYLCVDEAQDLNAIQYEIIRLLGQPNGNVLLVGCTSQAIYGFNGASSDFMEKTFCEDFQPVQKHELSKNYRSAQAIIRAANKLVASTSDHMNPHDAEYAYEGECLVISCATEEVEAQWVTSKIRELLSGPARKDIEGAMSLERMAVLARTRFAMQAVEKCLKMADIPFELRQSQSGLDFDSELIQVFDLGLCLLVNPRSQLHLNRLRKKMGFEELSAHSSKAKGLELLEELSSKVSADWQERLGVCLNAWRKVEADGSKLRLVLQQISEHVKQAAWDDHERARILTDIGVMLECWKLYTQNTSPTLRTLAGFRAKLSLGVVRPAGKSDVLTLATVHSVKGLEFDVVFLVGMVEGVFPDYRARTGTRQMREEQNDAFVAMTRARRLLYMTYPESRKMPWGDRKAQKVSRFIAETKIYPVSTGDGHDMRVAESSCES